MMNCPREVKIIIKKDQSNALKRVFRSESGHDKRRLVTSLKIKVTKWNFTILDSELRQSEYVRQPTLKFIRNFPLIFM